MPTINNINFVKKLESKYIQNEGQKQITLNSFELDLSEDNKPTVFIEGSFETDFSVISKTKIQLGQEYPVGTKVYILQYSLV